MQAETNEEMQLPSKTELIQHLKSARASLEQTLGRLSTAQLTAPDETGWSIKDHLAHIAAWETGMIALLHHQPRWQAMGLDAAPAEGSDANAINDLVYQHNRDRSLDNVLSDFRQTRQNMIDTITGLSDADLHKPYSFYQPDEPGEDNGDPIVGWIIGNTYEHDAEHRQWIEERLGAAGR